MRHLYRPKRVVDVAAIFTVDDMTSETAAVMKAISENTYVVPAKEETKRETLSTFRHYGTLAVVVFAIVFIAPRLTDPKIIGGLLAIAMILYGIPKAVKTIKGDD
jgi:hypothetical protein